MCKEHMESGWKLEDIWTTPGVRIDVETTAPALGKAIDFAYKMKREDNLACELYWLVKRMQNHPGSRVRLMKDFAPLSFYWVWEQPAEGGKWKRIMNGGIIFHGSHDNGGDGGAPTFSVNLTPTYGWTTHT